MMDFNDLTLIVGVDQAHLDEMRLTWPCWMQTRPELRGMPTIVFYDAAELAETDLQWLDAGPRVRLLPWTFDLGRNQREEMLTGFLHLAAREVKTPWYLKLDTDAVSTGDGPWIDPKWFRDDRVERKPAFVAPRWGYTKPGYWLELLDDWADAIPDLSKFPRLDIPRDPRERRTRHERMISWMFFGNTEWTRDVMRWLDPGGRMPVPSHDTFLWYCAARRQDPFRLINTRGSGWEHRRPKAAADLGEMVEAMPAASTRRSKPPTRAESGVVYFNAGTSCAVRLLVSAWSLRRHYDGPVTIVSEGAESHSICRQIADACGTDIIEWDSGVPAGRNAAILSKTRLHQISPYDLTISLDADTLVVGPIQELFQQLAEAEFVTTQFANWRTTGRRMSARIEAWRQWMPDWIDDALRFGPAINAGVFGFRRDAAIMRDWYERAVLGRERFIPDETCLQVMLPRYPNRVMPGKWNCSPVYDDPTGPDVRIVHFHGRKHCRTDVRGIGRTWLDAFEEVRRMNPANVRDWMPAGDRKLRRYLEDHKVCDPEPRAVLSAAEPNLRIILGAGRVQAPGWLSTEIGDLDVTKRSDWEKVANGKRVHSLFAEHVWEHLSDEDAVVANALCFEFLRPGGRLRIAVPDGFHPSRRYIEAVRPGGTGPGASDHKRLLNHETLRAELESAGFHAELLEFWDRAGKFHFKEWHPGDGHVRRSSRFDRRNRSGKLRYTSLIVDAFKR